MTLGGGDSIDKQCRISGISWWKQEKITPANIKEAELELSRHDNTVDYILTHACPHKLLKYCFPNTHNKFPDPSGRQLNKLLKIANFKHWYFAHLHINTISEIFDSYFPHDKFTGLFEDIIELRRGVSNV